MRVTRNLWLALAVSVVAHVALLWALDLEPEPTTALPLPPPLADPPRPAPERVPIGVRAEASQQKAAEPSVDQPPEPAAPPRPTPRTTRTPTAPRPETAPPSAGVEAPAEIEQPAEVEPPAAAARPGAVEPGEGNPGDATVTAAAAAPTAVPPAAEPPRPTPPRGPDARALRTYRAGVSAAMHAVQRYPKMARRRRHAGTARVRVRLGPTGALVAPPVVAASSGSALLDAEAVAMAERAAPFPALPAGLPHLDVTVPVRFSLDRPGRR